MVKYILLFRESLLLLSVLFSASCSGNSSASDIILTGSTPGDEPVKWMLTIPAGEVVDFIRWNLIFSKNGAFVLDIHYGESSPNTLGFKGNGKHISVKGDFSVHEDKIFQKVYHLRSPELFSEIKIVKLNENIFHLLTDMNRLFIGNGGWSYSFNRKVPLDNNEISIFSGPPADSSIQLVYEGRTPCQEMAGGHPEMKATSSCFKIKWKLTLNRDPITFEPSTCTIRNIVDNEPRDITGNWEIVKGTPANPRAIVYKIEVSNLSRPIFLFAGDEHVLFFLDNNYKPMVGNKDFSFTMNRRMP